MSQSLQPMDRMEQIIDYAYLLFCNQVAGGLVQIQNEASMQLHLSNILLQLGRLNVFFSDEYFNIVLEKKIKLTTETSKSKNRNARVDIWLELKRNGIIYCEAAIELKYLKKSHNQAVTDGRHHVYEDLENLEQYTVEHPDLITCAIIYTENHNFTVGKGEKFSIANDTVISSYNGENDKTYSSIKLDFNYSPIKWDKYGSHNFLKITRKYSIGSRKN